MTYSGNIVFSHDVKFEDAIAADARAGVKWIDPKLERAADGIFYPTKDSPVVDAAEMPTTLDSLVTTDVAGRTRSGKKMSALWR